MEKYLKPQLTVAEFQSVDVLTVSAGNGGSEEPITKNYDLPYIPIP